MLRGHGALGPGLAAAGRGQPGRVAGAPAAAGRRRQTRADLFRTHPPGPDELEKLGWDRDRSRRTGRTVSHRHRAREDAARRGFPGQVPSCRGRQGTSSRSRDLPDLARTPMCFWFTRPGERSSGIEKPQASTVVVFLRHRSGPVSLWYEIVSPATCASTPTTPRSTAIDAGDVVVDSLDEADLAVAVALRAGEHRAQRIVAVGGPGPGPTARTSSTW